MPKKTKNKSYLLCELDSMYALYATSNSFTIREKVVDKKTKEISWVARFFYSDIADALRGYVRHQMRTKRTAKMVNGDVRTLIKHVTDLNDYLQTFGKQLEKTLMDRLRDPIEHRLASNAMDLSDDG